MIGSQISVRVLGPVSLESPDGPVALGGTLPKGFLAVLALESPRPIGVDRLTALLWGEAAPAGVKAAVQQIASRVRRALVAAGLPDALRAVAPGYALIVEPCAIDVRAFRNAVRTGVEAEQGGDHDAAVTALTTGLDLWHGTALADLVDLPLATVLAPGLDDERWRAEELRAQALLAAGRPSESAELLSIATGQSPLRERLWVLQAQSLAAAGQPADAVRCARTGIAVITAELGVPPGPDLASIEQSLRTSPTTAPVPRLATPPLITGGRNGLLDAALRRALANAEHAARAATARHAHDEAVRQWQRALELIEIVDAGDDRLRLRLLLGLGEVHNTVSLDAEARHVFLQAQDVARRLGDGVGFAWAALGYCADRIGFSPPPEQRQMLEEALSGIGHHETLLRGRLLARLATEQYWTGSVDTTLELAEAALRAATAAGDDEGRLWARYAMAFGCWTPARTPRLVEVCETYLEEAVAAADHRHQLLAHRWLVPAVTELGDVVRGGVEAVAAMELADELGLSVQQWISRVIAASHQLVVGDLNRAETLATEALALGSTSEPETAIDFVSLFMWTLHWLRGSLADIVTLVEQVASTPGVDVARRLGLALTYGDLGRLDEARRILDAVVPSDLNAMQQDASWYISMAALAETAACCGHRKAAAFALERLRPYHERIAINSVTSTGPIAHHIGIAAWTAGQHDLGLRALADAVAIADRFGAPVFGARSRVALAQRYALLGDHRRAADVAVGAAAVADQQSLGGLQRAIAALLA